MSKPETAQPAPFPPSEFLTTFDDIEKLSEELAGRIEGLARKIRTYKIEVDVIEPREKAAIRRIRDLLNVIAYCEAGEERIMVAAAHEVKWIARIVSEARPCAVCGEFYMPVEVLPYFQCPECGTKFVAPRYFPTEGEARSWLDLVVSRERERGRDAVYCAFCVKERFVKDGRVYEVYYRMEPKVEVRVNQYAVYPRAFALVTAHCPECGYRERRGFPADLEDGKWRVVGLTERVEYEAFVSRKCPRCGRRLRASEEYKPYKEITEDDRYQYDLPFPRRGEKIDVPPKEVSGVERRYYFDLYKLEEPCSVGRLDLEFTDRMKLQELLDSFELYVGDREVRARVLMRIRDFVSALEENIVRDRTHMLRYPAVAAVPVAELKEVRALGAKFAGMLDVALRAYIRDFVAEHPGVLTPLREFKSALRRLGDHLARARPKSPTVRAPLDDVLDTLDGMLAAIPQLVGLARGIRGWLMDKSAITRRMLEMVRESARALREIGPLVSRPPELAEAVRSVLYEAGRAMTAEELAAELGVPVEAVREALGQLVRERAVRRRKGGRYVLSL